VVEPARDMQDVHHFLSRMHTQVKKAVQPA
jgi:hypothetical protein